MRTLLTQAEEAERLLSRRARVLAGAILDLAAAHAAGKDPTRALVDLAEYLTGTLALADLLARRRALLQADRLGAFAADASDFDILPSVTFREAVEDLVRREPRLLASIPGTGSVAERMGILYAEAGFSLARATQVDVIARVQEAIGQALRSGRDRLTTTQLIESLGDWSRAYANTVYRNNVNGAYTAGTFEQARDPDVQAVIGALRFDAIGDSRTTEICKHFDGTIAPPDHPIWDLRSPPCHHGCRSSPTLVDRMTLRRMGLEKDGVVEVVIPNPDWYPAPGFGRRRAVGRAA